MLFSLTEIGLSMKSTKLPCNCMSSWDFRERRMCIKLNSAPAPFGLFPWLADRSSKMAPAGRAVWGWLVGSFVLFCF